MQEPNELSLRLNGWGVTLAEFYYRLPDAPKLLAPPFTWQFLDLDPDFPKLRGFADWWQNKLDGKLVLIQYSHHLVVAPGQIRTINGELKLH